MKQFSPERMTTVQTGVRQAGQASVGRHDLSERTQASDVSPSLVRRGIWQQRLFRALFPMTTEPFPNQLARAEARWENEGERILPRRYAQADQRLQD